MFCQWDENYVSTINILFLLIFVLLIFVLCKVLWITSFYSPWVKFRENNFSNVAYTTKMLLKKRLTVERLNPDLEYNISKIGQ